MFMCKHTDTYQRAHRTLHVPAADEVRLPWRGRPAWQVSTLSVWRQAVLSATTVGFRYRNCTSEWAPAGPSRSAGFGTSPRHSPSETWTPGPAPNSTPGREF